MLTEFESKHHKLEPSYWFFVARRDIIKRLLYSQSKDSKILEIGCASGMLIKELTEAGFKEVFGVDISKVAIDACLARGVNTATLVGGTRLPFADQTFDVLISSDVLEHIKDDRAGLAEWARVLKPGGQIILLVPAFPFLWSEHDVANKHYRRYTKGGLLEIFGDTHFEIKRTSFWNFSLFPPMLGLRVIHKLLPTKKGGKPKDRLYAGSPGLNFCMRSLLYVENFLIAHGLNFPFGGSLLVCATKR